METECLGIKWIKPHSILNGKSTESDISINKNKSGNNRWTYVFIIRNGYAQKLKPKVLIGFSEDRKRLYMTTSEDGYAITFIKLKSGKTFKNGIVKISISAMPGYFEKFLGNHKLYLDPDTGFYYIEIE